MQIIYLLQALDKFYIHLRKLKHLKNEAVKANIAATKERGKSPSEEKTQKEKLSDPSKSKSSKSTVGDVKENEDAVDSMPC